MTRSARIDADNRRLPAAVRDRNRAVAEREASRLARPEPKKVAKLGHASRAKSAVTSTPFGYYSTKPEATSNDNEEWCGPFSVARQMIAKREEARRKREADQANDGSHHPLDEVMMEVELEQQRKAHPSMRWVGRVSEDHTSENLYSKRQKRVQAQTGNLDKVPTLFQLCLDFVVDNFEHVEALGDVDSSIRRAISEELVAKKKLDGAAFDVIAEEGIETLELVDCAEVTQEQMASALKLLVPSKLRFLLLGHAGRCFGPKAVEAIVSASTSSLFAISVSGAYLLADKDAASLIGATASTLTSIEFAACPLLGFTFCNAIKENFSSPSNNCLLELNLQDMPITEGQLLEICSSDALRNLKKLGMHAIQGIGDSVVLKLLDAVGDCLEAIDFGDNFNLSDNILSGIRRCNKSGALRSLELNGIKNFTPAGLEALFTHGIAGLPNPPQLRTLSLASSDGAVTDNVIDLVTKASAAKHNDTESVSQMRGLVNLCINGAHSCTDKSMEYLAATSVASLKELDVSFCVNVTDQGLGYLVSKAGNQLTKISVWGCAQLTDEFFDGHNRVGDSRFEIAGAWMKRAGAKSLR